MEINCDLKLKETSVDVKMSPDPPLTQLQIQIQMQTVKNLKCIKPSAAASN